MPCVALLLSPRLAQVGRGAKGSTWLVSHTRETMAGIREPSPGAGDFSCDALGHVYAGASEAQPRPAEIIGTSAMC